jgi:hypothetical protein
LRPLARFLLLGLHVSPAIYDVAIGLPCIAVFVLGSYLVTGFVGLTGARRLAASAAAAFLSFAMFLTLAAALPVLGLPALRALNGEPASLAWLLAWAIAIVLVSWTVARFASRDLRDSGLSRHA